MHGPKIVEIGSIIVPLPAPARLSAGPFAFQYQKRLQNDLETAKGQSRDQK
jgi:hypothetical protein